MDNRDTCGVKDRKKMDGNKVWPWRILHAKKYSRHQEPFYHSNRIGLDFNVASNTQKKIDSELLTNAVIRELYDFAKTVQNSKKYFIPNILENNFDLGLENEQQRKDFTDRILNNVKDLIKRSPEDKKEVFTLFDTSSKPECNNSNGLNTVLTELKTESSLSEMDDTDDREHDKEFKFSQATSKEHMKTESVSKEMDGAHDDSEHKDELECSGGQPAEELTEAVLPPLFPCCEEIGLNLDVGSKQSLSPGLLTKGVMLELVHFTKILTGTHTSIVLNVLEHNFEVDLTSEKERLRVWSRISFMLERRKRAGGKNVLEIENEPFSFRNTNVSALSNMEDQLTSTDIASTLPTVNSNVNLPFTSQPDDKELCGGEAQTQISRNAASKCDMEPEEMETENNMWKLRTNRVKQIVSGLEVGTFKSSKKCGLEFNVGFSQKQNINIESLPVAVLLDIAKFALAMNSSQQDFIMEILEYNFDFGLQSQHQRNVLTCEIMNRVRTLKSCEDAVKFSREVFELPGPLSSVNVVNQSEGNVNPELSSVSRVEECDVAPVCPPHSNAEIKEHISQKIVDLYPFCKEIGLNLQVNNSQPHKKLDIKKLTYGVMTEVMHIAEKLCGTFEQICLDIIRHNVDLDSQSGDFDLARSILAQIIFTKSTLDCQNYPNLDTCGTGSTQAAITEQNVGTSTDTEFENVLNLKLWKLRASQIQQILSVPHAEHCPLYFYSRCKKLGIDFNVGSGVKQNLDLKLLTNGIMVELNTFATELLSAQKYFITEILEYNFHLDFNNELHRNVFTQQTMDKIRVMNLRSNNYTPSRKAMLFELPDERLIQERAYDKAKFCPKCFQDRNHKLLQDESDSGHMHHLRPHAMTDTVSADAKYTAQKPAKDLSSTLSAIEETIMDCYPHCKELGLNLCVDKYQPQEKLDTHVMTRGTINEVAYFAKKLCGTKSKLINDVLEHNFNISSQGRELNILAMYHKIAQDDGGLSWSNEVFVIPPLSQRQSQNSTEKRRKREVAMQWAEWKQSIKTRKLALQTKKERLPNHNISFPICTAIGLDLELYGGQDQTQMQRNIPEACDMEQEELGIEKNNAFLLGETEIDSDAGSECEMEQKEIGTHNYTCHQRESGCQGVFAHFITTTDISSTLPAVNSNVNPSFSSEPNQRGLCGGEEQTEILRHATNNYDMEQDEMPTDNNLWKFHQSAITDQNEGSSTEPEYQDEHNLQLWKLRANHIQRILSVPHVERCPFYSYSRCKKLGIDFNVGSGIKQNLDPKLLTNGIMVELNTFATELLSAQKHFITEILEYNFHLDFNNELHRSAFAKQTMDKIRSTQANKKYSKPRMKMLFELPDLRCIQELTTYCPKCYQDRTHNLHKEESDSGHRPHTCQRTTTDAVSADANCTAQQPATDMSSTFSASEDTMMNSYPRCKETGFQLCVVKDQPIQKLDMDVLTRGIVNEVASFTKKLCGTKHKIINDVLEHNFNISRQWLHLNPALNFQRVMAQNGDRPDWFDEVYGMQQYTHRQPGYVGKVKRAATMYSTEWKETIKKRKLALQTKEKHYTCPLGESDLDSDNEIELGNSGNQDHLQNPHCSLSSDVPRGAPLPTTTEISSSLPIVNSDVNQPVASQTDIRRLCGGEEQTQIPRDAPNECDMDPDQMETENNMWKIRANRVKQILSASELGPFNRSKKLGVEFNVGFSPKNNSVDSLTDTVLLEVAKFALAMNSSQQFFIMEILEYNFHSQSEYQRNIVACEILNRVKQLKAAQDAIKLSKEIFELPFPMASAHVANQSFGSADPEINNVLIKEECDVTLVCPPHSHAETKQSNSLKNVDLYPFCKEIGLKLQVNNSQPNKKLDISKLTNGAMTEVANLAEKLCGTFEQICLDIFTHNLDLDLQIGDSGLARSLVAKIPAVVEQRNLATCLKKIKGFRNDSLLKLCSSQAAITDQEEGTSTDIEHQNVLEVMLWKLRANHIQQILSVPHLEHCPLYSYSRCKKLGIDFNVGSGVKQNLDPKLLTNGIMVELNTFATELLSAQKHFVTEILEYNFDLNFNNELHRSAFTQQTSNKVREIGHKKSALPRIFELPDTRCLQEVISDKVSYCPKCYQDRSHALRQDESVRGHLRHPHAHATKDTASAGANCTAQNPAKDLSSTLSAIEETIMTRFPCCKKIGLNLCVDKDRPKGRLDKLDPHVLTCGTMVEVTNFAKRLCAAKNTIIHAVLEHNFDVDMRRQNLDITLLFQKAKADKDSGFDWFSEVFVIQPIQRQIRPRKLDEAPAIQRSEMKEASRKRQLALQIKEKESTLPSHDISDTSKKYKSRRNHQTNDPVHLYPFCTEIGLDLDVTSRSEEKEKLDLKLLTRAVVAEIHKFATRKIGHYLPHTVFDILDYNFDLSSQYYRRWEFSIATTSKVQSMVNQYRKRGKGADKIFKLPFVSAPKDSQRFEEEKQKRITLKRKRQMTKGTFVRKVSYHLGVNRVHFLDGVKTKKEARFHDEDANFEADRRRRVQRSASQVSLGCGSPLQANIEVKEEQYDPYYEYMNPESYTEENDHPYFDDAKTESIAGDVEQSVLIKPTGHLGHTFMTLWPNAERQTESENETRQYYVLAQPQGPAVWPDTASNVTTAWTTEGVQYLVPVAAAESEEYSMLTIGEDTESTLIKEEPENVPVDSEHYGAQRE